VFQHIKQQNQVKFRAQFLIPLMDVVTAYTADPADVVLQAIFVQVEACHWLPVFVFDLPLQRASADAKPVNFASNLAALALFSARGAVLWEVALPMAAAQFAGGWLGAHLAVRGGDRLVRTVVLLVVLALVAKLATDMVRAAH